MALCLQPKQLNGSKCKYIFLYLCPITKSFFPIERGHSFCLCTDKVQYCVIRFKYVYIVYLIPILNKIKCSWPPFWIGVKRDSFVKQSLNRNDRFLNRYMHVRRTWISFNNSIISQFVYLHANKLFRFNRKWWLISGGEMWCIMNQLSHDFLGGGIS